MGYPKPKKLKPIHGLQRGKKLSPEQQEMVVQLYALTQNYREVARQAHLSVGAVKKYVDRIPPAELQKRRAETQLQLASKFHEKTELILDSIDAESVEKSNLSQRAIAAGIFTDKKTNLINSYHDLASQERGRQMLTPQSIEALLTSIRGKMESLQIKVDFAKDDLPAHLEAARAEVEVLKSTPLDEVQSEDEFDGYDATAATPAIAGTVE